MSPAAAHFVTAEDVYHPHQAHPEHTPPEAAVFRWWRHSVGVPAPQQRQMRGSWPTGLAEGPLAEARVDHGRWVVDCPFPGCNSAQFASKTDHRFFCVDCSGPDRLWVPVVWPDDIELAAIEAALSLRPEISTRSWESPGWRARRGVSPETVADLLAENAAHGL